MHMYAPHSSLLLDNQVQCAPLSAQQREVIRYSGPVTCTSIPWTVVFGDCNFSGDYAGAPLIRTGECPFQSGGLGLNSKGITSISVGVFANMGQLQ